LICAYFTFKKEPKFNATFCAYGAINEYREIFSGFLPLQKIG